MLCVLLTLLAGYVGSTARTIMVEDDGEFAAAAYFAGVPHPPGYPLFILFSHLFTWLPVGSVGFRVHLASAVSGAAACAVLWWTIRCLVPSAAAAYVGALGLGLSGVFWSQATVGDVYALNALLFSILLALSLAYVHAPRAGLLVALALVAGFALSNHWPLIALAAPAIALTLLPAARPIGSDLLKAWPRTLVAFALGLSPYLWMVLRSRSRPELAFYGALDSWAAFWGYVTRAGYAAADVSPSAGWWDTLQLGGFVAREIVAQYTVAGAVLAAIGAVAQWKRWGAAIGAGLTAGFLAGTFGLVGLLGADYEFATCAVVRVFPLIPYAIMGLWVALGFERTTAAVETRWPAIGRRVAYVAAAALLGTLGWRNLRYNDHRNYEFSRDFALTILESLEPSATLVTHADLAFVLNYFHYVEGVRSDVRILNDQGLGLSLDAERLFHPMAITDAEKARRVKHFVEQTDGPMYFLGAPPIDVSDIDLGLVYMADKTRPNSRGFSVDDQQLALVLRLAGEFQNTDPWTVIQRNMLIGRMAPALTAAAELNPSGEHAEGYRADLERVSGVYEGLLSRIDTLDHTGSADQTRLLELTERARGLVNPTVGKEQHARLYVLRGRILAGLGRLPEALEAFETAIEIFPHPRNDANRDIAVVLRAAGAPPAKTPETH
jgi:hypothetical protein